MTAKTVDVSDEYVLNHCAKYLARDSSDPRHNFGQFADGSLLAQICESWRFPIVDSCPDLDDAHGPGSSNRVTFIYRASLDKPMPSVAVVGTFAELYAPMALRPVRFCGEDTGYLAICVAVPTREVHRYKFIVDGVAVLDALNPQQVVLDNARPWSRFFTQHCNQPLSFENWEYNLLERLVRHILPFRTKEGQNFMNRHYFFLDRQTRDAQVPKAYRLDESVGATNYIDCLVAREESHHAVDYKICLAEIYRLLRQRFALLNPHELPAGAYADLYDQMAAGNVPGWDTTRYQSPSYFLQLLRRHTYTGAFSHPKHGGNIGAAGWEYLDERFQDDTTGRTLFDWRRSIEAPLGANGTYNG